MLISRVHAVSEPYALHVADLARFHGRSPQIMSVRDVRQ